MILQIMGASALITSVGLAWTIGGRDERIAAAGFVLATLVTPVVNRAAYHQTESGVLLVDLMLLAGLIVLALRSDRFWPMWAAAFQLVGTTVHFASMAETGDYAWAYAVGLIFWSYPVMLALGLGTWLEGRHRRAAAPA